MFLVFPSSWDGPLPLLLSLTTCLGHGDIIAVTTIISHLLQSSTLSLDQDVKSNCKPIRTKRLNYYHIIQIPNVDLSLRPYITNYLSIDQS